MNIDIKKTLINSVAKSNDFYFFVDELTSDDYMPTYQGVSDEKYKFGEMNDEFFDFLLKKSISDGIYIRLVYVSEIEFNESCQIFKLEWGDNVEIFKTDDLKNISDFDFADYGIKIKNGNVSLGATIEFDFNKTPYFAEFGSKIYNERFLSFDNPLNKHIIGIIEKMLF